MSLDAVSPAPATPAFTPHDTTDVEDWNTRQHLVMENAVAETKAARAAGDLEDDEVAEAVEDANDDTHEAEAAPAKPAPKAAPKEAPVAAAPAEPSAEEKNRKASLANAARLERESVKRSTELAAKAAELKAQEAKFADREGKLAAFEKAYNDPDALLALLSDKVTPEKMSQFFIEAGQPDKVAERRAKAALEGATKPVNDEVTKLREEMEALRQENLAAKAQVTRSANEKDFAARTLEIKEEAPHAARLLNKRPKEFYAMADVAATQIMAAAKADGRKVTWDDVIRDVNQQLADFAKDLADEAAPAAPSTPTKVSAAAKAPTVSNRAASERSAILDEDEKWDALSYDERVSRAIKRARATG